MAHVSRRTFCGLAAGAAAAAASRPAFAADRLQVTASQRGAWETAVCPLGMQAGIFAKHGLDLAILWTQGSGDTLQAVISGGAEIGMAAGMVGVLGAFAKGAPVRVIGAQTTGPADFWYVKASSPIQMLKDYKKPVTVAFGSIGSSTHTGILRFVKLYGLDAKLVQTGGPQATLTQVMSDQVDVGWTTPPLGIDRIDSGELRRVGSLSDIPAVRDQTVRVNIANARFLARQPEIVARFAQAYRETLDWMYADPAALAAYVEFSGYPPATAKRTRDEFFPKASLDFDRISGVATSMEDAIDFKVLSQPLTEEQIKQLVQIPRPL